jgi:hypothetical protein
MSLPQVPGSAPAYLLPCDALWRTGLLYRKHARVTAIKSHPPSPKQR